MRVKVKIGVAVFLVGCLLVNIAALVKHYKLEDKAVEAITEAVITEVSKELTIQPKTHEKHTQSEKTHEESTERNKSLGEFVLFAYCPCTICSGKWGDMTATGVRAKENHTIAVDPSVIPYGTEVVINGHIYRAEDNGADVKGKIIDIYFDTHEETENFKQYAEVFLVGNQS